jgi:MoaA/NifB/PqqE/SkfB family radical SAM enzyme
MIGQHLSVILLPTNKCNVACEYCFEDKTDDFMPDERPGIASTSCSIIWYETDRSDHLAGWRGHDSSAAWF